MLVFDIETGPQDEDTLLSQFVPKTREEFVGAQRWKPETIDAKYAEYLVTAKEDFIRKASLDATTGQILAIGYKSEESETEIDTADEGFMLSSFWRSYEDVVYGKHGGIMVGHNIIDFDLPFIVRRSWILGVDFKAPRVDRNSFFVDTMKAWTLGSYQERISLDRLARTLGMGGKSGKGEDFARLWKGTIQEHLEAREYLVNDLNVTWNVAKRLGIGR
jgi:hypothetical protein